ncbi:hypothetical protein Tco_1529863 [Tanacetum coccineum]
MLYEESLRAQIASTYPVIISHHILHIVGVAIEIVEVCGAIRAENQNLLVTISELKARMKNGENGMNATSSVKRPKSRDSHVKTSVLDVSKNEAKKEAVYVRKNKQTDTTFANVMSNKDNVVYPIS